MLDQFKMHYPEVISNYIDFMRFNHFDIKYILSMFVISIIFTLGMQIGVLSSELKCSG